MTAIIPPPKSGNRAHTNYGKSGAGLQAIREEEALVRPRRPPNTLDHVRSPE